MAHHQAASCSAPSWATYGGNVHPAHLTAATHDMSSPHLMAVHGTASSVVLPFSGAQGLLYGMNTMCSQLPSQALVGLPVNLVSPHPSQGDLVVTSHHTTQPLGPARGKPSEKHNHQGSKGELTGSHFKETNSNPKHSSKWHKCFLSSKLLALFNANMERGDTHLCQQEAIKSFPSI